MDQRSLYFLCLLKLVLVIEPLLQKKKKKRNEKIEKSKILKTKVLYIDFRFFLEGKKERENKQSYLVDK